MKRKTKFHLHVCSQGKHNWKCTDKECNLSKHASCSHGHGYGDFVACVANFASVKAAAKQSKKEGKKTAKNAPKSKKITKKSK